jgi:glucose dehydrogenase
MIAKGNERAVSMIGRHSISVLALGCIFLAPSLSAQTDWPGFGNDPGSTRYSPLKQINAGNVSQLKVAWTFDGTIEEAPPADVPLVNHADAVSQGQPPNAAAGGAVAARPARRFARLNEAIPIVIDGVLYTCTAYRQIVAIDAESGKKIWEYSSPHPTPLRGISYWPGEKGFPAQIVYGTGDGWLVSLDAKTGKPSSNFGTGGMVDIKPGVVPEKIPNARAGITSPLSFYKNYVFTGSSPGEFPTFGATGDIRA